MCALALPRNLASCTSFSAGDRVLEAGDIATCNQKEAHPRKGFIKSFSRIWPLSHTVNDATGHPIASF